MSKFLDNVSILNGLSTQSVSATQYLGGNTGNWNTAYTTTQLNSSNWNSITTGFANISANDVNVWNTVNSNSAITWNYQGTDLKNLSADWIGGNSAFTTVQNTSTDWNNTKTTLNSNSASWIGGNSAFTTVNSNSSNWNSVYTTVQNTSSNPNVSTITVNTSALVNALTVVGDVTITGNLSTLGSMTYLDTKVQITSSMTIDNAGTGPALNVTQSGDQQVAIFYDGTYPALVVNGSDLVKGYVGIGTTNPNTDLTIVGDISATGNIYGGTFSGGNTSNWNNTYTTVQNTSTDWNNTKTTLNSNSSSWIGGNSAFTTVNANSANWNNVYTTVQATSTDLQTLINTVSSNENILNSTVASNSATTWNYQGTDLKSLSSGWVGGNSAFTTVNANSANWNNSFTGFAAQSANNSNVYTTVQNTSSDWNNTKTTVNSNSASWIGGNSAFTTVNANSANWNNVYTTVQATSTDWNTTKTTVNANSANWNNAFTGFASQSANTANVWTTVNLNSATTWNYQGTDLKNLSASWVGGNSAFTTVNTNSSNWNNTLTIVASQSSNNTNVWTTVNSNSSSWVAVASGAELQVNKNQPNGYAGLDAYGNLNVTSITVRNNTAANLSSIVLDNGEIAILKNIPTPQLVLGDGITSGGYATIITGLNSQSTVVVTANGTPTSNGNTLLSAYQAAKTLTPYNSALSTTNRATVLLSPGLYDLGFQTVSANIQYVDLVGVAFPQDTIITSSCNTPYSGTLYRTANDIKVCNVTLQNSSTATNVYNNSDPAALAVPMFNTLSSAIFTNVIFVGLNNGYSMSINAPFGDTYNNCIGGNYSFGSMISGYNTSLGQSTGIFNNCIGGQYSFGGAQQVVGATTPIAYSSGTYTNCIASDYSFGGIWSSLYQSCSAYSLGTYTNCIAGAYSFGGVFLNGHAISSGIYTNCEAINYSFGGGIGPGGNSVYASGTYISCSALGATNFGSSIGPLANAFFATGNFYNCTMNSGWYTNFSGYANNCTIKNSGDYTKSGYYATSPNAVYQVSDGATFKDCVLVAYTSGSGVCFTPSTSATVKVYGTLTTNAFSATNIKITIGDILIDSSVT